MIIDTHSHAWSRWPYQPPVPDDGQRGRVEQLLYEMNLSGVDQAVLICAQIEHNPENNAYVAEQVARHRERLIQFADVDSAWSTTYHQPGAAGRLLEIIRRFPIRGFTHYLNEHDDGAWLASRDGLEFFALATEHKLIASLSCYPHQQAWLREVARAFPSLPILCHHLGWTRVGAASAENLNQVLESASCQNIYIKISGFAYAAKLEWNFPYHDALELVRAIYDRFGARRLCWGDYPVVRSFMTYRQALEVFRTHCDFVSEDEKTWILGKTFHGLMTAHTE